MLRGLGIDIFLSLNYGCVSTSCSPDVVEPGRIEARIAHFYRELAEINGSTPDKA